MADSVNEPLEEFDINFYKGHPKKKVTFAICIICECTYYKSDFAKLKKTKQVGEHLVVCPEHNLKNISSKSKEDLVLSDTAKSIIAHIKLKQSEKIREELLTEIHNKTVERQNSTVKGSEQEEGNEQDESDFALLIAENTLLKKLVDELQDKNQLQKEVIELQRGKNTEKMSNTKSYAEAAEIKPKPKRIPKITVKVKDPKQKNTMNLLNNCIIDTKNIQTKFVRQKNESEIEISCMNMESVESVQTVLKDKLNNCDINIEQQSNPKIKIIGINNTTDMDLESIEDDINIRNFNRFNKDGKVLHMYINKRNKTTTVLMEVTPDIYKYIRENKNKVFVGHQYCKVYDLINITPCYNCGRFGHNASKCRNDLICIKCSGNHSVKECKNSKVECVNCTYNNEKFRTSLPTDHLPTDRIKCSILKNKIKKYINSVDYPIQPILPTWDEATAWNTIQQIQANDLMYQRRTQPLKNISKKPISATVQRPTPASSASRQRNNDSAA